MKHLIRMFAAAAALALAVPASAQQRAAAPAGGRVGLGVAITPLGVAGPVAGGPPVPATVEVYVPLLIAPQIRLEPSVGLFTRDEPAGGTNTRDFTLGIGGFYVSGLAANADLYAGARLKLNFAKVTVAGVSSTGTDVTLAAALGGEYYLVPRVSIGLEGQLGLYSNSRTSGDTSGFFTAGLAFLRLYFM